MIIKVVKNNRGHQRYQQLEGQSRSSALLCLSLPGTHLFIVLFFSMCLLRAACSSWNKMIKRRGLWIIVDCWLFATVLLQLKPSFVLFQIHQPFTMKGILCLGCILVPVLVTRHIISIPPSACTFAVCTCVCFSCSSQCCLPSYTGVARYKTLKNKLLKSVFNDC